MPDTAPISFRLLRPPILGTLLIAHLNGRSIPVGYVRFTSISDVASNVPNAQIEVNLGRCGELALIAEKCDHREWSRKDPEGVLLRERARPTRRTFSVRSAFGPRKHLATNIPFDRHAGRRGSCMKQPARLYSEQCGLPPAHLFPATARSAADHACAGTPPSRATRGPRPDGWLPRDRSVLVKPVWRLRREPVRNFSRRPEA